MSDKSDETRDRVRALVRQVLESVPVEDDAALVDVAPEHVVVNSLREKAEREYDRDESAKSLITEDDLRGLDFGSRVRVSENAKFTPLASDIVGEKGITLIRKKSRSEGLKVASVGIGADHGGYPMKEQLKTVSAPTIDKTALITKSDIQIMVGSAEDIAKKDRVAQKILADEQGVVYVNVRVVDRATWRGLDEGN